jgi:hypothetical protein
VPSLPLSDVRRNLARFSREWADATGERQQAQGFWREFFACFGITGATAVLYEHQVRKLGGAIGYIDSFIPGKLIVEAKSRGRGLNAAFDQAADYALALPEAERPRYIVTSDFDRFVVTNLSKDTRTELHLSELSQKVGAFSFLVDDEAEYVEEREVDREAAYRVSRLHKVLLEGGLHGEALDVFLTRLLWCFFADDTGLIGINGSFDRLLRQTPPEQLGGVLSTVFQVLDTPVDDRPQALQLNLARLPYVNGSLFSARLDHPVFDERAATLLRECSAVDYSTISPLVFGTMFQGILEGEYRLTPGQEYSRQATRRESGSHFTSERNVMKALRGLFLDELRNEFEAGKTDADRMRRLYNHLPNLTFLDPAAGAGSFLVVAYRELRRLEMDIVDWQLAGQELARIDTSALLRVTVKQFHGIELSESAAEIAKVALWITDHQLSIEAATRFGSARRSLPLKLSPTIKVGNALRMSWDEVIPATHCDYIISNPPWVGSKYQSPEQRADMSALIGTGRGALLPRGGTLDYVAGWFIKAAQYIEHSVRSNIELDLWAKQDSLWGSRNNDAFIDIDAGWQNWRPTKVALLSTSSIVQGEQVAPLFNWLFSRGLHIQFAHRVSRWRNEGRGVAAVYFVTIGFGEENPDAKPLFDYPDINGEAVRTDVTNISPYLLDGPDVAVSSRTRPLEDRTPALVIGNKPVDDGNYLFKPEEKAAFLADEPAAGDLFRPWLGSDEMLNGVHRDVLWVRGVDPARLLDLPLVRARIDAVRKYRAGRDSAPTRQLARTPERFHVQFEPTGPYLAIPKVSSERRLYVPMAFVAKDIMPSDLVHVAAEAKMEHLGLLSSKMYLAWLDIIGGKHEGRYRNSAGIVYNTFPWPEVDDLTSLRAPTSKMLQQRDHYLDRLNLGDLYYPENMPAPLRAAHTALDAAVDALYRYKGPDTAVGRVEFLFPLYVRRR